MHLSRLIGPNFPFHLYDRLVASEAGAETDPGVRPHLHTHTPNCVNYFAFYSSVSHSAPTLFPPDALCWTERNQGTLVLQQRTQSHADGWGVQSTLEGGLIRKEKLFWWLLLPAPLPSMEILIFLLLGGGVSRFYDAQKGQFLYDYQVYST
ncbi:hypothetical protein CEXT_299951 [Caerostris extrusa]|uniref:Uncharacterized protein n=1 Tax=Caerostris extrusa TaxID=172846 RepID=A0AAV4X2I9_CAEEX|nr:hypothetical protein CEXT_299951 [Caerostris extrusa]